MSEHTVDSILSVATKLFAERGIAGVSIQEIADQAGIAAGTVIYHFKTKKNLLFILARDIIYKLYRESRTRMEGALSPLEALHRFTDAYFDFAERERASLVFLTKLDPFSSLDLAFFPNADLFLVRDRYISLIVNTLQEGIDKGAFTALDPHTFSMLVWSMLWGAGSLHGEDGTLGVLQDEVKALLTCRLTCPTVSHEFPPVCDGLLPPGGVA